MSILSKIKKPSPESELPIAPLIDVVFLLLMYFMLSSTIQKQEADLSFSLPGTVRSEVSMSLPDEQIILIRADGQAILNEFAYDSPTDVVYRELAGMLSRFRQNCESGGVEARVTLAPDDATRHGAIVKVMDACAYAGIPAVSFASHGSR